MMFLKIFTFFDIFRVRTKKFINISLSDGWARYHENIDDFFGSDSKNIEKSENFQKQYFSYFSVKFYLQSLQVSRCNSSYRRTEHDFRV